MSVVSRVRQRTCGRSGRRVARAAPCSWPRPRRAGRTPSVRAGARPAPSADEQFFAPAVLRPIANVTCLPTRAPAHTHGTRVAGSRFGRAGNGSRSPAVVVFFVAAVATAWFVVRPERAAQHEAPVVLAPAPPTAGLPTSLAAIVRIEAESTRHTALQTVEQVGTRRHRASSRRMQPSYQWVPGDQPSTDPHVVSVGQSDGVDDDRGRGVEPRRLRVRALVDGRRRPGTSRWRTSRRARRSTRRARAGRARPGGAASDLPDDNG